MKRRLLAMLMAICMAITLLPTTAFASEGDSMIGTSGITICPHHEHDESCGYQAAVAGTPCTFDPAGCEICNPKDSGAPALALAEQRPTIEFTKQPQDVVVTSDGSVSGVLTAEVKVTPPGSATLEWFSTDPNGDINGGYKVGEGDSYTLPSNLSSDVLHYYVCRVSYGGQIAVSRVVKVFVIEGSLSVVNDATGERIMPSPSSIEGVCVYTLSSDSYTASGTTSRGQRIVMSPGGAKTTLTLNGVTISGSTSSPISCEGSGSAELILAAGTTNIISADAFNSGINGNKMLTITGSGSLVANGGYGASSGGGTNGGNGGAGLDSCIVASGNVTANGGSGGWGTSGSGFSDGIGGPGIRGGGITGGTVTATGASTRGNGADGIAGCAIRGGTVTAIGGFHTGAYGSNGIGVRNGSITGGSVNANSVQGLPANSPAAAYVYTFSGMARKPVTTLADSSGTSLQNTDGAAYGEKDIFTDSEGKIYLWHTNTVQTGNTAVCDSSRWTSDAVGTMTRESGATYTVTLPTGTGYTAAADSGSTSPVSSGGSYSFTVTVSSGYHTTAGFKVKANGTELTAATGGVYTINNITAAQTVTVEGVEVDTPVSTYELTVANGTGSGSYTAGAPVSITADAAPTGQRFKTWTLTSGGGTLANADSSTTDFTMPANAATVTATYEAIPATTQEQFTLPVGETYWFDLSGVGIPGTPNTGNNNGVASMPDATLHYVPFTYAGTVNAYSRSAAGVSTDENVIVSPRSLFISEYAVTNEVSWDDLNGKDLIFGKAYNTNYTLRAPSVGSDNTGSASDGSDNVGTPNTNEWDMILDKDSGYIKNWSGIYSWGQDTSCFSASSRALRGNISACRYDWGSSGGRYPSSGFRPVLEVLNPDTLTSGGLKAITLNLGGGKLKTAAEYTGSDITTMKIVYTGATFTAPAETSFTRPTGNTGSYFKWLGSDGKTYTTGDTVPSTVTELTAQWAVPIVTHTVSVSASPAVSGTVTGGATYAEDTSVTVTASAKTGYHFVRWTENGAEVSTAASYTFTITANRNLVAVFEPDIVPPTTYTVTVTGGTASPTKAKAGDVVTLTANAAPSGKRFKEWTISPAVTFADGTSKNSATAKVTMPAGAVTATASFENIPSGSTGGSDNDYTSPAVTVTASDQPNTPTVAENTAPGKVDKDGNAVIAVPDSALNNAIKKAQETAKKNGASDHGIAIVINATGTEKASGMITDLSASAIKSLTNAGVKTLTINCAPLTVTLDLPSLKTLLSAGGNVKLTAARMEHAMLSTEGQTAIGNRPAYQLSATAGGKAVTQFGGQISVAIPYTPAAGETTGGLFAVYVDAGGKVTWLTGSSYNSTVKSVLFGTNHFSAFGIGYKAAPVFADTADHWAKADIKFVAARGLLNGTSNTAFSPNTAMTRGMFVTALGRLAGIDSAKYKNNKFSDVSSTSYYAPYVAWAAEKNITSGTTATTFSPEKTITRQELATLMQNYAKAMDYTLPKTREESIFADSASISTWAKSDVKAMQMAGVMNGKNGNKFDPTGTATRAEVAATLRRYVELVVDPVTAQMVNVPEK